jgi:hypothetical protein
MNVTQEDATFTEIERGEASPPEKIPLIYQSIALFV